jgi:GAF domain-containing protein
MLTDLSRKNDSALSQNIKIIAKLFTKTHIRENFLSSIVKMIRDWTDCQCVGIRVINDEGFMPYESYVGFSYKFWTNENCLSIKKDQCACIRVMTGTPDPLDLPILTDSGSIWTNDLQGFGSTIPEECYNRYRGKCIESEFASFAVLPIRYNSKLIGLIHLADFRKDMLPKEHILILESVAPDIGEVVLRFSAEDDFNQKGKTPYGPADEDHDDWPERLVL